MEIYHSTQTRRIIHRWVAVSDLIMDPLGRALARKSFNTLEKTEHKHGSYRTQCVCCTVSKAECLWISHLACANAPQTVSNSI